MYVMTSQPAMIRRRRRTLGDALPVYGSDSWYWQNLKNWIGSAYGATQGVFLPPAPVASVATSPTDQPGLDIPGSGPNDYLMNAKTGKPTQAQLDYNAQQYIDAAAQMRQQLISQGVTPPAVLDPATVAAQAKADQAAYAKSIGGTADQLLANLKLPTPGSVSTWLWIAAAGVIGAIWILRSR